MPGSGEGDDIAVITPLLRELIVFYWKLIKIGFALILGLNLRKLKKIKKFIFKRIKLQK